MNASVFKIITATGSWFGNLVTEYMLDVDALASAGQNRLPDRFDSESSIIPEALYSSATHYRFTIA